MKNVTISSISDLLVELEKVYSTYDKTVWFRGQTNSSWPLIPGYMRLTQPPPETEFFNQFKQSAALLAEFKPAESFDWMMLMQHYGVPTRLLDWSESPLVGLFFALCDESEDDAALWVLKPCELNKNANIIDLDNPHYIPSFQDDVTKPYSLEYLNSGPKQQLEPIAVTAVRNNARIQAQSGVFTIHHKENNNLDEINRHNPVIKFVIPNDKKCEISKQLKYLGITKFQMFPELSTIGEMIRGKFE